MLLGAAEDAAIGVPLDELVSAACGLCLRTAETPAHGSSRTGIRKLLQSAAAIAAQIDPEAELMGRFTVSLVRDILLPVALSGEPLVVEEARMFYCDIVDLVGGTASWLPTLAQPARELLLHTLHDASVQHTLEPAKRAAATALAQAVSQLCMRGVGGGMLALRHEERLVRLLVEGSRDQHELASVLNASETDFQPAVRLAFATDMESADAQTKVVLGKTGITTHYSLLTTHYSLLATHYSLLTTHYSLLTTHCSLPTTHHLLLTTHYSLLTTHYSLLTTEVLLGKTGLNHIAIT